MSYCILHLGQATTLKTTSRTCSLIWSYVVMMLISGTPSLRCLRPLNVCCAHTSSTADNSSMTRPARPPWRRSHVHPTSLLTQAIKSRSAAPSHRSSATNADHRRRPPTPTDVNLPGTLPAPHGVSLGLSPPLLKKGGRT